MELAGIDPGTSDPAGGRIARDASGAPTGLLVDNAMDLVTAHVSSGRSATMADLLRAAQARCVSLGLVGVHDAGVSPGEIEVYRELERRGELQLRVHAMVSAGSAVRWMEAHEPASGDHLSVRAVKCFMDGSMGSRGAWLLEPYADFAVDEAGRPYTGLPATSPEAFLEICRVAVRRGYQVATHAIGDRANREVLDAYEAAFAGAPPADRRFRVEHAQLVSLEDLPRFAAIGVIPSMQPTPSGASTRPRRAPTTGAGRRADGGPRTSSPARKRSAPSLWARPTPSSRRTGGARSNPGSWPTSSSCRATSSSVPRPRSSRPSAWRP